MDDIWTPSSISTTANPYNIKWVIICYSRVNELIQYCPVSILIDSRTNQKSLDSGTRWDFQISIRDALMAIGQDNSSHPVVETGDELLFLQMPFSPWLKTNSITVYWHIKALTSSSNFNVNNKWLFSRRKTPPQITTPPPTVTPPLFGHPSTPYCRSSAPLVTNLFEDLNSVLLMEGPSFESNITKWREKTRSIHSHTYPFNHHNNAQNGKNNCPRTTLEPFWSENGRRNFRNGFSYRKCHSVVFILRFIDAVF